MEIRRTELDNGVRIVTNKMGHVRSASLIFYFATGARHEVDQQAGVSHFLEHMVFKGTNRRPDPVTITREIEEFGGVINAGTSLENTNYWVKVPSAHLPKAFDVLADIVIDSTFREEELEKERWVIVEEIHGIHDTPDDYIHDVIDALIWDGQPVGRPIVGTQQTVGSIQRPDLVGYRELHYRPNRLVIAAAGDIDHDTIVDLAERSFGTLSAVDAPQLVRCQSLQSSPRVRVVERQTEEAHLCVGLPAIAYTDERRQIQDTIDAILSSGMSSRLFQEIRERRGLAYAVFSYFRGYVDVGQGVVYAGTDPQRVDETVRAIIDELWKLRQHRVSDAELSRIKEIRKARIVMGLEDSRAVAGWLGGQELLFNEILSPDEVMEEIESVTADQILELAQELFREDRLNLALIGPFENEDKFRSLVE